MPLKRDFCRAAKRRSSGFCQTRHKPAVVAFKWLRNGGLEAGAGEALFSKVLKAFCPQKAGKIGRLQKRDLCE